MRKDSWYRGPLLSGLFFALLLGGGPGIAVATDAAQSVTQEQRWTMLEGPCQQGTDYVLTREVGCVPYTEFMRNNTCDQASDFMIVGGAGGIFGGLTMNPVFLFGGAAVGFWGAGIWLFNDC